MTKEFILKRIQEQTTYLNQISKAGIDMTERDMEVYNSAQGQYQYFTRLAEEQGIDFYSYLVQQYKLQQLQNGFMLKM